MKRISSCVNSDYEPIYGCSIPEIILVCLLIINLRVGISKAIEVYAKL